MFRVALAAGLVCAFVTAPAAQQATRLVVIIVADQFRADYLTTFAPHWRGGVRTLLTEGAVFRRAAYSYAETETCPGHFTIGTGALPRTHGMVTNDWWDERTRRLVECTEDEQAMPVTYGRASKLGKSARHLLVPTLADELRTQRPGARVVSLSVKARSAIGLAGHAGDAVTWFEETIGVGSFLTSSAFSAAPVPAVKAFIDRNPIDREFDLQWTLRDPASSYRFRDAGIGERPRAPRLGLFPHTLKGLTDNRDQAFPLWRESPYSDAYLGRLAAALIDAFDLGQGDRTDFLGISFSATDTVGHNYGPESREVEDTVARLDDTIGALIAHLDARVGRSNYVLGFSSDHGVAPIPLTRGAGRVASDDVRERIEEVLTTHFGKAATRWVVAGGNQPRLAEGAMARLVAQPAVLEEVQQAVTSIPGVDRLLRGDQLSLQSKEPLVRGLALSYMSGRSGDLIVVPKPQWIVTPRNGTGGAEHGTFQDYDRQVPLILFGGAIRAGQHDAAVTPADIAPTLASVAGVRLPRAEGRVLREALK